jgi:hypothetical protein
VKETVGLGKNHQPVHGYTCTLPDLCYCLLYIKYIKKKNKEIKISFVKMSPNFRLKIQMYISVSPGRISVKFMFACLFDGV